MRKLDSQVVEIIGRNRLVNELLHAGVEVAMPARDRGIDLIAYVDLLEEVGTFAAIPIQMKAASGRVFGIDRKYKKFPNLIIAYVWHLAGEADPVTFAMSYADALEIATEMGWIESRNWGVKGAYVSTAPSLKLCELLEPHRTSTAKWLELVTRQAAPLNRPA